MEEETEQYPTIPAVELLNIIRTSSKYHGEVRIGTTLSVVFKGNKHVGKRSISFRDEIVNLDYEYAIAVAFRSSKLTAVTEWFEKNRNFKEGAFTLANIETDKKD